MAARRKNAKTHFSKKKILVGPRRQKLRKEKMV